MSEGFDKKLEECEKAISKQIETIQSSCNDEQQQKLLNEYNALLIRQALNENAESVVQFWKDAMVIKKFADAEKNSLTTTAISKQKTQLVKKYADQTFIDEVSTECKALGVRQTVTLKFSSPNAVTKHKTQIAESNHDKIHEVLSEGESRAVSLACFLAEARIISKGDTLIFDDPVCSLDHRFRERVADRIAKLASDRQVIVFTHDLVFWSELRAKASEVFNVDDKDMYHEIFLERVKNVTGQKGQGAPWKMIPFQKRLANFKERLLEAKKFDENYQTQEYEALARGLGSDVRIAWEKLITDELFNQVVLPYRSDIQTKRLYNVNITTPIYENIRVGVTKTSGWGPHDEPLAKQTSPPNYNDLEEEITRLETCLQQIEDAQKEAKLNRKSPHDPLGNIQLKSA